MPCTLHFSRQSTMAQVQIRVAGQRMVSVKVHNLSGRSRTSRAVCALPVFPEKIGAMLIRVGSVGGAAFLPHSSEGIRLTCRCLSYRHIHARCCPAGMPDLLFYVYSLPTRFNVVPEKNGVYFEALLGQFHPHRSDFFGRLQGKESCCNLPSAASRARPTVRAARRPSGFARPCCGCLMRGRWPDGAAPW